MNTYTRKPEWSVTIKRPDYTKPVLSFREVSEWSISGEKTNKIEFVSSEERSNGLNIYTDLIGYEYNSSLKNQSDPFSLTLVPRQDRKSRLTWKDKIQSNDVVFISEFGKVRYIGIVKGTSYSMSMNNGKPQRSVSISGSSIGGKIETFNLPMNLYLWFGNGARTAEQKNNELIIALSSNLKQNQDIGELFKLIKDKFLSVNFGSDVSSKGFAALIDKFFELDVDNLEAFYPMLLRPFQTDSNTLWSIFRQILPEPIYEIYGLYEKEKYKIICRETPFDFDKWDKLPITTLNPLYLKSQDLNDTDSEIYTHFFATATNSQYSQNEIYADKALREVSVFDSDKLSIYGYRQLQMTYPFVNKDIAEEENFNFRNFLKENSVRLFAWYHNNVEFQSGTITMMTVPEKNQNNEYINIGERIKYLEGSKNIEFYVESIKRKMSYPNGGMISTYSVTRGYEYGKSSVTIEDITVDTPQVQKISQLGMKLIQSEKVIQGDRE